MMRKPHQGLKMSGSTLAGLLLSLYALEVLMPTGCTEDPIVVPPPPPPTIIPDTAWVYMGLGEETISALAVHPTNPNVLYAGSLYDYSTGIVGKLFRTLDGGRTWDTVAKGGGYSRIVIDPQKPQTIYAAPGAILKSTDAGRTWHRSDSGIRLDWEHRVMDMAIDPSNSYILYAGTSGVFGGGLYKSTDAAASWTWIGDSLRDGVISLSIDPTNGSIIYAGTSWRGLLWKSTDGGGNWRETGLGETLELVEAISVDPAAPWRIFVGLSWIAGAPLYGFWLSEDSGATWAPWNEGLGDSSGVSHIVVHKDVEDVYIFAASRQPGVNGIYRMAKTGGVTWQKFTMRGFPGLVRSDPALEMSSDGKTLWLGGPGVFRFRLGTN